MSKKVAINGFGRIGRLTFRILEKMANVEVVAINDLTDNKTLAHLLKYDSAQGIFDATVSSTEDSIIVDGRKIHAYAEKDPKALPWKDLGVDVVLDCTGVFRNAEKLGWHIEAGAKKVVLSAPGEGDGIKTIVIGVNDQEISEDLNIYSNASCTTNCLSPAMKLIIENFGYVTGSMVTIHAYTQDQNLQDAPHKDLRRARAAALNIIPTTTGAAKAAALVLPELKGKMTAMSYRVPVITGSLVEINCLVEKSTTTEEIRSVFKAAAEGSMKGILEYSDLPLVSSDIIGNPHSCIFDADSALANDKYIKVVCWYDNEAGYSNRLAELTSRI
jgi:glyceraldehyde 3-phosphate dehydrogenase